MRSAIQVFVGSLMGKYCQNLPFAHLSQYTLFALHKFCISIVFNFLWDNCHTQEKGKIEVMQTLNNFSLSLVRGRI